MAKRLGRPLLYDAPTSERLSINVTPGQRVAVQRVAQENGQTVTGIIREALNE